LYDTYYIIYVSLLASACDSQQEVQAGNSLSLIQHCGKVLFAINSSARDMDWQRQANIVAS
jgi:hypothetical protein